MTLEAHMKVHDLQRNLDIGCLERQHVRETFTSAFKAEAIQDATVATGLLESVCDAVVRVRDGKMIAMRPTNAKLRERFSRIHGADS
mgnify:CR=1 FL=1